MRREREAEKDPDSKIKRREEGRALQREGQIVAKDRSRILLTVL